MVKTRTSRLQYQSYTYVMGMYITCNRWRPTLWCRFWSVLHIAVWKQKGS